MGQAKRRTAFEVLAAVVTVLLAAAVLAATSIDRSPSAVDAAGQDRVVVTDPGLQSLEGEQPAGLSTGIATVAPPPARSGVAPPTANPTANPTATSRPAAGASPTSAAEATLPPGVPLPNFPTPKAFPTAPIPDFGTGTTPSR